MKAKRGFIDGEYQDGALRGLMLLAGKRGMGKTTEMDRLLHTCSGGVLFFDSLSKHASVLKGYTIIHQPGQLKNYLRANFKRPFRILYQPKNGSLDAHFRAVAVIVKAFGWMIFALDEIDKLCGPRWGESRMPPELYELVNYGRHYRVSMLATARRPKTVARGYTSECLEMRLFRVSEKADIDYFAEFCGDSTARRLPSLEKYQYLRWTDDCDAAELCGGRR